MFKRTSQELAKKALDMLNSADSESKSQAIYDVVMMVAENQNEQLIAQLKEENEELQAGKQTYESLGLKTNFTEQEKKFYNGLCHKNSVVITTNDVFPETTFEQTMKDIHLKSGVDTLWNKAPAGVSTWIFGSHTGAGAWGSLNLSSLTAELTATLTSQSVLANKGYVIMVVPKSIAELSMPFVDKYLRALMVEAMEDLMVNGYLYGNGQSAPIGIAYKLPTEEGTVTAKQKVVLKDFTIENFSDVRYALSNDGKRSVGTIHIICNPADASLVKNSLYLLTAAGYVKATMEDFVIHEEPQVNGTVYYKSGDSGVNGSTVKVGDVKKDGDVFITIENEYTYAINGISVDEYKETKALDDANLLIGKVLGTGRPSDDHTAVVCNAHGFEKVLQTVKTKAA